ncbi:hypothetical protein H4Q26_017243, partial [Puccinia striiformis f. sp. tritici PST-130]
VLPTQKGKSGAPTRKGKSGAPQPEETSDEEAISDKEASTSEEEDSTSEEEKPATKKPSQPKKPANTLRPNLITTKEEKKPAPAPKKKPAPTKTASLPSTKKITPIHTATLCPRPPPQQPLPALNLKMTLLLSSSDEFPAPTLLNDWAPKATVDALKWRGKYTKCFELTVKTAWLRKQFDQALVCRDLEKSQWENQNPTERAWQGANGLQRWPRQTRCFRQLMIGEKLRELWQRPWEPIMRHFVGSAKASLAYPLLWKAKSDLYKLAVTVRAEKELVITTDSGNGLGTRLKEKIMGAINRCKNLVEKAIKRFNKRRQDYLQKVDPLRLLLPENQDLTLADFKAMDVTNPPWNNNHFYHAPAPWASDPNVRKGIKLVLFLDWVEEEGELLTQEIDQSITWACEYHRLLRSTFAKIDLDAQELIDPNNEFTDILPTFTSMKGKW